MQLISYLKSFCSQFKEGEYYRRNFRFFKEPKFSGLPKRNLVDEFPFQAFPILELTYKSPLVGYCVEEAFSHMGLWNGFGGGNVSEVHIGYFEDSKTSINPLITVFEDDENWYFRVANCGTHAPDPSKHVLFFRGTATVVKIDINVLQHFYEIDYKEKVTAFRRDRYYAGSSLKEKQKYLKGISQYPRVFEVVCPIDIFTCWDDDGHLTGENLKKYQKLEPIEVERKISIRNEDLDNVGKGVCRHCGIVYEKRFFDVGTCSFTCNFDPSPSKKILPSGFRKSQEDFIKQRYPYLERCGIEICSSWFTEDLYLEPQMARYYLSECSRWNFLQPGENSKSLVLWQKPEVKKDLKHYKVTLYKRRYKCKFGPVLLREIENYEKVQWSEKIALDKKKVVKFLEMKQLARIAHKKERLRIQKALSYVIPLNHKYVEKLIIMEKIRDFLNRPRSQKILLECINIKKFFVDRKQLTKYVQVVCETGMTYEEVNNRMMEIFGPLDYYQCNGKTFKTHLKEKQKHLPFNNMNTLMRYRTFNVYLTRNNFEVFISDVSNPNITIPLFGPMFLKGYELRNEFDISYVKFKSPGKLIYKTESFEINWLQNLQMNLGLTSNIVVNKYSEFLDLNKDEMIYTWPKRIILEDWILKLEEQKTLEGWSQNSIDKLFSKLKIGYMEFCFLNMLDMSESEIKYFKKHGRSVVHAKELQILLMLYAPHPSNRFKTGWKNGVFHLVKSKSKNALTPNQVLAQFARTCLAYNETFKIYNTPLIGEVY